MRKEWCRGWESGALREVWGGTQGDTFLDVDMEENPERDLGEDGSVEEGARDVPMKKYCNWPSSEPQDYESEHTE